MKWLRRSIVGALIVLGTSSCAFGPRALERTHGLYNEAVKEVYEEQLLLNLVRLRYNDNPNRLEVSSIAAQYELSGMAQAQPFFTAQASGISDLIRSFTAILPAAQVLGANRPTVTLTPADDHETIQRFLTPLNAENLIFLVQIGWPVSTIFRLYVDSLNGVPNATEAGGPIRDVIPEFADFQRLAELLQIVQDQGLVRIVPEEEITWISKAVPLDDTSAVNLVEAAKEGYQYRVADKRDRAADIKGTDTKSYELFKHGKKLIVHVNPMAQDRGEIHELTRLLHLQPGLGRYEITVGPPKPFSPQSPPPLETKVHMVPRSTVQTLFYLSRGVIVPVDHVKCGIAMAPAAADGLAFDWPMVTQQLFTVHSCKQHCRPEHAHAAVKYHGYWFYIDDRDQESKATFTLMLQLVRLDIGGKRLGGPLLTLPLSR
jgi:hypothetical protein